MKHPAVLSFTTHTANWNTCAQTRKHRRSTKWQATNSQNWFTAGEWYTPLREALSAYFDKVNETVTGTVKLKLYKGNIIPAGSTSPYSLYNESMASFTTGELYNHKDADGFINLFGLPLKVRAMMMANHENK